MADANESQIETMENWPYIVTGGSLLARRAQAESENGEPLDWDLVGAEDADYKTEEICALWCRQSENRSICDGSHKEAGFRAL
jgi:CDGSH-type Zn-finger protein